jgi:uncharacterized HAD superfamily protein
MIVDAVLEHNLMTNYLTPERNITVCVADLLNKPHLLISANLKEASMITFDIDGTLAETFRGFHAFITQKLSIDTVTVREHVHYHDPLASYPDVHHEDIRPYMKSALQFGEHGVLSDVATLPHALETLTKLHQRGLVSGYVTRRNPRLKPLTQDWLTRQGFPNKPLIHVEEDEAKSHRVRELGGQVMVEDAPHEADELASAGLKVILIDQPYNREVKGQGITRVRTWLEFETALEPYLQAA